jgi:hypothetical protein
MIIGTPSKPRFTLKMGVARMSAHANSLMQQ